uniref:Uncharacterized protein n=1 Tax=Chlamydomonas euryale TaxID=1486919 RepID=A0A7R9VGM3_9CHLO
MVPPSRNTLSNLLPPHFPTHPAVPRTRPMAGRVCDKQRSPRSPGSSTQQAFQVLRRARLYLGTTERGHALGSSHSAMFRCCALGTSSSHRTRPLQRTSCAGSAPGSACTSSARCTTSALPSPSARKTTSCMCGQRGERGDVHNCGRVHLEHVLHRLRADDSWCAHAWE